MNFKEIRGIARQVGDARDAAVIVYSGPIDGDGVGGLLMALQPSERQPQRKNVILILTTNGGQANAAYQIARILQQAFDRFELFVPMYCKSAGTLIALGAHALIMEQISELGPLDVQLYQKDEIGQRRSGLILKNALDGLAQETLQTFDRIWLGIKVRSGGVISFDTASRLAANMASQVMAPVYAQINPEALGNDLRDLNVATEYGVRLAKVGKNAKQHAVETLVHNYPAHDFIIDREEAKELFDTVASPDVHLDALMKSLGMIIYRVQPSPVVLRLDEEEGGEDAGAEGNEPQQGGDAEPAMADRREDEGAGDQGGDVAS